MKKGNNMDDKEFLESISKSDDRSEEFVTLWGDDHERLCKLALRGVELERQPGEMYCDHCED